MSEAEVEATGGDAPLEQATSAEPAPSFPPPVAATIDWLRSTFAWYYDQQPPPAPHRHARREFGFMLWPERPGPPPFFRHRAYSTAERLQDYLAWKGPHSCYYSTAYYRKPAEKAMVDKQWLGAELIFDLDADHLEEAEAAKAEGREMPIQEQLVIVKRQFKKLLDEFLFGDFGLTEDDVWLTFSGGRGYHAHVVHPKLMALDAKGRREIVDYITGKIPAAYGSDEPDLSHILSEKAVSSSGGGPYQRVETILQGPRIDEPGWRGRLTRNLVETLETNVHQADDGDAIAWLQSMRGIGKKGATDFVSKLTQARMDAIKRGVFGLDKGGVYRRVLHHVLAQQALPLGKGETDEPVTADVKRLIRLPGSLHGKSGLKVVQLTRDQLDDFDPFVDAVVLPADPVRFTPRNDGEMTLAGERVSVKAREETEVPLRHAVWWCARQQGTVHV